MADALEDGLLPSLLLLALLALVDAEAIDGLGQMSQRPVLRQPEGQVVVLGQVVAGLEEANVPERCGRG